MELALTDIESDVKYARDRAPTYSALRPENAPTILTFSDVSVFSKRAERPILDKLSGTISGGFWAIMGSSGRPVAVFYDIL